ncbi:MAG: hypothetical protein EOP07_25610, partial [Proteobacteria bacterium]
MTLEWSKNRFVRSFEVAVAKEESCSEPIFEKRAIKSNNVQLDDLYDGHYFLCVYGRIGDARISAKNNGVPFIIDRTNPVVTVPVEVSTHGQAFNPNISMQDTTALTVEWSTVSGPGAIAFDDKNSATPMVSADKNGIYKIKATISDQAGHTVEQIYQFYWNGQSEGQNLKFVSLAKTGVAADGFIQNSEKNDAAALWILSPQTLATKIEYTAPLDDSAADVSCDNSQTYDKSAIASALDLSVDGAYVICVKLSDADGHVLYGKSETVVRDSGVPIFTSLANANAAA